MYYSIVDYGCDDQLTRKCDCGGTPEMITDNYITDYMVRCTVCHKSTKAWMRVEEAVKAWQEKNLHPVHLDLLEDDYEKSLSGCIVEILFDKDSDSRWIDDSNFKFYECILKYENKMIAVRNSYGCLDFDVTTRYNEAFYQEGFPDFKDVAFSITKIEYDDNHFPTLIEMSHDILKLSIKAVSSKDDCDDHLLFSFMTN